MEINSDRKKELRRRCLAARRGLAPDERRQADAAITARLLAQPEVQSAQRIFTYLSMNDEVSTRDAVAHFLTQNKQVFVPSENRRHLPADGFFQIRKSESGTMGTATRPEPISLCQQLDIVIVPGIAWDRDGFRVGFGGGYFDRLLAELPATALTVGLAYGCQVMETAVPRDPWDLPVDVLITEAGVYRRHLPGPLTDEFPRI